MMTPHERVERPLLPLANRVSSSISSAAAGSPRSSTPVPGTLGNLPGTTRADVESLPCNAVAGYADHTA